MYLVVNWQDSLRLKVETSEDSKLESEKIISCKIHLWGKIEDRDSKRNQNRVGFWKLQYLCFGQRARGDA